LELATGGEYPPLLDQKALPPAIVADCEAEVVPTPPETAYLAAIGTRSTRDGWPDTIRVLAACGCDVEYGVMGRFLMEDRSTLMPCSTETCNFEWDSAKVAAYNFLAELP
jgi:hypothetical protein